MSLDFAILLFLFCIRNELMNLVNRVVNSFAKS